MAYAFGVCQTKYIVDPKGQMNKLVVEELLFNHDIKPPYTMQIDGMLKRAKCHITCRNPTLAKCGGEAQHLEKLEVWSPPGLPNV